MKLIDQSWRRAITWKIRPLIWVQRTRNGGIIAVGAGSADTPQTGIMIRYIRVVTIIDEAALLMPIMLLLMRSTTAGPPRLNSQVLLIRRNEGTVLNPCNRSKFEDPPIL